jgi:hypothetical protein
MTNSTHSVRYRPLPGVSQEQQRTALSAIYRLALETQQQKKAGRDGDEIRPGAVRRQLT